MGFLRCFQQLRSYRDETETWNWEEILFISRVVPRLFSVAEGPLTALHNAVHLYNDQANPHGDPVENRTC